MTESSSSPLARDRLILGCVLLGLSLVPWAVVPFTPLLGLPAGQLASVIAVLVIGAEIMGLIAIAVLGKEAYGHIIRRLRRSRTSARDGSQNPPERHTRDGEAE